MNTPHRRTWLRARLTLVLLCAGSATAQSPAPASAPDAAATGLQAVAALAQVNGLALACQERDAARRAKALMLAHAPKTQRYGLVFDDGTQQAFLAQTRTLTACPDATSFTARLDALAQRLQADLPVAGAGK
jgi:hypothetical protein